ncbi:MAG TPA: RNA polymerase subunit sigma-70 [Planctomycetaceae bacterium]|nr:RNA polymerase subunit sigma-70 [Planctomycetaceae bacterium]
MTETTQQTPEESGEWFEGMYDQLHKMATSYMRNEQNTVTLSPTVLIHELYLRLPAGASKSLPRTHFFALAAANMRRALVDQARYRNRKKRGGGVRRQQVDWEVISSADSNHVLAVDEALTELAALDKRQADVVEMRFFGGMTVAEVAEHLDVSKRTVEADWTMAKAWLRRWFDSDET